MQKKKVVLIIAAAVAVIGAGLWGAGTILDNKAKSEDNIINFMDPESFKPGNTGTVHLDGEELFEISDGVSLYDVVDGEEYWGTVIITNVDTNRYAVGKYLVPKDDQGRLVYKVTVRDMDPELKKQAHDFFVDYYTRIYEHYKAKPDAKKEYLDMYENLLSDEGIAEMDAGLSHPMCEVTPSVNYGLMKTSGIVTAVIGVLMAVICLLSFRFKAKTIALGFGILAIASVLTVLFSVRKQIATVMSLKQYQEGVYTLKYTADYKLDDCLDSGLTDESDLLAWCEKKLYFGLPVSMKENLFGCAAFLVKDPDGNYLMGRNTDYPEADCLMLYCNPKDGYDSIAMVDLSIINIGSSEGQVSPESFTGRASTLAMPYMIVEGMNEAGLGVSILQLDLDEIHMDTGRKDVLYNVAVRGILDKCATVDEAVKFFENYDMNSMLGATFHLFVCDKTGRSVVIEWLGDKMYVTDNPAVTNYVIGSKDYYIDPGSDDRYEVLMKEIEDCGGVADAKSAMGFLSKVGYDNKGRSGIGTEWSCVYDLDNFTVTVCFDVKYGEPVVVTRDTFK